MEGWGYISSNTMRMPVGRIDVTIQPRNIFIFSIHGQWRTDFRHRRNGAVTCKRMIAIAEEDKEMNKRLNSTASGFEELYQVKGPRLPGQPD